MSNPLAPFNPATLIAMSLISVVDFTRKNSVVVRSKIVARRSTRRFFSVKIYRASGPVYLGIIPRWTRVLLRRIIRRVIFHVNAQRERHPGGRRHGARLQNYLVRLSVHGRRTSLAGIFRGRQKAESRSSTSSASRWKAALDRELPLIVTDDSRRWYLSGRIWEPATKCRYASRWSFYKGGLIGRQYLRQEY